MAKMNIGGCATESSSYYNAFFLDTRRRIYSIRWRTAWPSARQRASEGQPLVTLSLDGAVLSARDLQLLISKQRWTSTSSRSPVGSRTTALRVAPDAAAQG